MSSRRDVYYTYNEAADLLNKPKSEIRRMVRDGVLTSKPIKGGGMIPAHLVDELRNHHVNNTTNHNNEASKSTSRSNPFIKLLTLYGRSAENEAAYDESLIAAVRKLGVKPPSFDHPVHRKATDLLGSSDPPSIVLTGGAGDGKTHLCRQVYQELNNHDIPWNPLEPIQNLRLESGKTLQIVKDFTELGIKTQYELLENLSESVFGAQASTVYLIAANEGIITRKASTDISDPLEQELAQQYGAKLTRISNLLDELLIEGLESTPQTPALHLFDLSRLAAADMLKHVIDSIVDHEGWGACDGCTHQGSSTVVRCLLYENRERLRQAVVQRRMRELVQMLDLDRDHLTVRHLYMLVANAITGHAAVEGDVPMVMDCTDLMEPPFSEVPRSQGAYFQNIFGLNLRRQEKSKPFFNLLRLGVGAVTNNRIDNLLTYGDIDPELRTHFEELVLSDAYFVDKDKYVDLQTRYRERSPDDEAGLESAFAEEIATQRRRLYFELPVELEERYRHNELVRFPSAANFRQKIMAPLAGGRRAGQAIVRTMILGLNRVFVGGLTDVDDRLYLATSGTISQSRVSDVLIHALAHDQLTPDTSGITITSRGDVDIGGFGANLNVNYQGDLLGQLPLTLSRYEFLSRVAEGVSPVSFSVQVYEDILIFKSQLLQNLERRFPTDQLPITTLRILSDGQVETTQLLDG